MARVKLLFSIIVVLFLLLLPAWAKDQVFEKKINNVLLSVSGPASYVEDNKKIFYDPDKKFGVKVQFEDFDVRANRMAYNFKTGVIELYDGFKGQLEEYRLEGSYFRANPETGHYAGSNLKFGYMVASLYGEEFQFYGDSIVVENITASPLQYPVFNLLTGKYVIFPGYSLAQRNTLRLFIIPIYYIPLYIEEARRSYFDLPFPALEGRKDVFHGIQAALHTHYFINPGFYGDLSLRSSDKDGTGAGFQQIFRLSDEHQMELKMTAWEKADTQTSLAYEYHIFDNPRKPGKKLSFKGQLELEKKIAAITPNYVFHADYKANEEIKRSIVDRYPDLSFTGFYTGIFTDHTYTFTPSLHYGKIKEKRIYPEGTTVPQAVNRDYSRTKGQFNYTYYLSTPRLYPYIRRILLGVDYEHSIYDPGGAERDRFSGSLTVRRPILKDLGLYYELVLTKTLLDSGQSPFFFEEYGRLMDSATLDLYLQMQDFIFGNELIYDITNGQQYNEIYYVGVRAGGNYAVLRYDRRQESWEFAFMGKEAAF